jgi:hypothetical protein
MVRALGAAADLECAGFNNFARSRCAITNVSATMFRKQSQGIEHYFNSGHDG